MNLIAFSGPRNCVNTQYAALSGAMILKYFTSLCEPCYKNTHMSMRGGGGRKICPEDPVLHHKACHGTDFSI